MSQVMQMNNGSVPPAIPADLLALVNEQADKTTASFMSSFNILKFKRSLELTIDGVKEEIEYGKFAAILITSSEFNHALWYKQSYRPGGNDQPDLTWIMNTPGKFPDALPTQYWQKVGVGKDAHWGFQIRRRSVWVRVTKAGMDFDHPFIIDIPSSLLYGKSDRQGCYTWRDIIALCKQESSRGVPVYPGMFVCKFVAHTSPQQGLFYFQPVCDQNGYLKYLSVDILRQVLTLAKDPDILAMAAVREKLTYEGQASPTAQTVTAQQTAQAQQPSVSVPSAQAAPSTQAAQAQQPAQAAQVQQHTQTAQVPPTQAAQVPPTQAAQAQQTTQETPSRPAQAAQAQQATGTAALINEAAQVLTNIANAPASSATDPQASSVVDYFNDLGL